jgi:integrase
VERLLEAAERPVDFHGRGQKGQGNSRPRLTPIHALILFILNTGARLAEAMYLEWDKVSFRDKSVHFANIPEHALKDYEDRSVKTNPVVLSMLRHRRMREGSKRWVFSDVRDEIFDRKNLLRELKRIGKTAKIRKVNFLILRHTALTAWARAGTPPFILKEMAGHADVRTSQRYYIGMLGGDKWLPPVVGG